MTGSPAGLEMTDRPGERCSEEKGPACGLKAFPAVCTWVRNTCPGAGRMLSAEDAGW